MHAVELTQRIDVSMELIVQPGFEMLVHDVLAMWPSQAVGNGLGRLHAGHQRFKHAVRRCRVQCRRSIAYLYVAVPHGCP